MFRTRSPFAESFKMFIYVILTALKMHRKVDLETAMDEYKSKYEVLMREKQVLMSSLQETRVTKRKMQDFYKTVNSDILEFVPENQILFQYLLQTKATAVWIYIVNPVVMKRRAMKQVRKAESSDEEETQENASVPLTELDYNFGDLQSQTIDEIADDQFYYFIPPMKTTKSFDPLKYTPVAELHFVDKEHYNNFIVRISLGSFHTCKKNIALASLNDLRSVASAYIAEQWHTMQVRRFGGSGFI
jgi:hypothetical protein